LGNRKSVSKFAVHSHVLQITLLLFAYDQISVMLSSHRRQQHDKDCLVSVDDVN